MMNEEIFVKGHKGAAGFTADRIVYENIQKLK